MQLWDRKVIVRHSEGYKYGRLAPFHPNKAYPELTPFGDQTDVQNSAYEAVRQLLIDAGFDARHLHSPAWNPLAWLIKPGSTVVLKPNFVRHYNDLGEDIIGLITHGSVIRVVADYVFLALRGEGRIVIADSPQDDADFSAIMAFTGLESMKEFYRHRLGFNLEFYDLRQYETRKVIGVVTERDRLVGDPNGYRIVDLKEHSMLTSIERKSQKFYGADYDVEELHSHHKSGVHEYCIAQTVLDGDVIINLPKLKTHKKCGVTLSMKNLVGINGNKNYLPHYTLGSPANGGDQFCENNLANLAEHYLLRCYKRVFRHSRGLGLAGRLGVPLKRAGQKAFGDTDKDKIRSGNWYGNTTIWRTVLDLNRILLFCDKQGQLTNRQQRGYLSIIDGLVGGEGNGPLACRNRHAGFLIMGHNPLDADAVASYLMGFDPERIPLIREAYMNNLLQFPPGVNSKIECAFNGQELPIEEAGGRHGPYFEPHPGWKLIQRSQTTPSLPPLFRH